MRARSPDRGSEGEQIFLPEYLFTFAGIAAR
jgi:hypothetical protein